MRHLTNTFHMLGNAIAERPWPLLLVAWLLLMLIAWPVGEFAINDDWAFSAPVRWWVE